MSKMLSLRGGLDIIFLKNDIFLKKSKVLSLRGGFDIIFENIQKWYKNDVFLGFATPHMIGHVMLIQMR